MPVKEQLEQDLYKLTHPTVWMGCLTIFGVIVLALELYFGIDQKHTMPHDRSHIELVLQIVNALSWIVITWVLIGNRERWFRSTLRVPPRVRGRGVFPARFSSFSTIWVIVGGASLLWFIGFSIIRGPN